MLTATQNEESRLAPPGAGLPKPELMAARLIFRWKRSRSNREKAASDLRNQTEQILRLARSCDAAVGRQRVLIPRLRGLEDSSRYWSVFMTLDHLRIVNDSITGVIRMLVAGRVPSGEASTAAVKPAASVDEGVVAAFEESCRNLEQCVAASPELVTKTKYAHPWFGPLDAERWHFMAGFHMDLHRKQVEAILAGVSKSK